MSLIATFLATTIILSGAAIVINDGIKGATEISESTENYNSTDNDTSINNINSLIIQTRMNDKDLLTTAIKEYSKILSEDEQNIFSDNSDKKMKFHFNKEPGNFEVVAYNFTKEEALKHIDNLFDIYTRLVQQKVYERVKSKLEETNEMTLDNEEVLEDESIVLTVGVN